jgi:hypothetical protein
MDEHFDEGVAGAGLAVLFTAGGAGILNLLSSAEFHTNFVLGVSALVLAGLGGVVGIGLVRHANRRPANGHHADYADTLSNGGGD